MEEAIPVVEQALRMQADGEAANRPRGHDYAGPGAYQAWMQSAAYGLGVCGFKTYTIVGGAGRFFVYLYGIDGGPPLSIMEANRLGQAANSVIECYNSGFLYGFLSSGG